MMKLSFLRLLFVCVMTIMTITVMAQSSGDKLYSQGLELQKKQTVPSQKSAIAKFQSAKKLYDSATKKKQCDDAIAVSNNIIKSLSVSKGPRPVYQKSAEIKASVLELSNEKLTIDHEKRSMTVNITTTEEEWTITPITNADGEAFLTVNPHQENKYFEIVCPANTSTRPRQQTLEVRAGDSKKLLVVEQSGKPTILSIEKTVLEFSNKGGSKSIEVYSNSDTIEEDNNNRNWKVIERPDWVNIIGEEYKEKGFLGKIGDKAKGLINKGSVAADDPSVITSVMKVVAASKDKNQPSRSGEIVISSENQQATIIVQQK